MYYLLFTTTTCIKCPSFKKIVLEKIKFSGEILDETSEKFIELAGQFSVMNAPTFIIFEDQSLNKEITRCLDELELEEFLKKQ